jgi:ketosteroid isomerase-like protein
VIPCAKQRTANAPAPASRPAIWLLCTVPASLWLVTACTRGTPLAATAPVDLVAEKNALLARDQQWQAAVTQKTDVAKIASFFSADGIMFGSGEATDEGHEALTKSVAALVADPSFKDHWAWSRVELSSDGRLAYLVGSTDITTNDVSGRAVTTHARLLNVWRKDSDGVWRCVVDVWVDPPSLAR